MLGNNVVTWKDHEGTNGFGAASEQDLSQLLKALTAGQDINPPASAVSGDGFALRVESLERTLRNTTYRMEHIRLFKALPKLQAYNTVEEYNQLQSYGADLDAFIEEGGLPNESDSTYERKFNVIKYLGTTRRVSHVMSLVKPAHGNVIAQETVNGTMHLLRAVEKALIYGDSSMDDIQWDGYEKLINDNSPAANIIDKKGAPLNEDDLIESALVVHNEPNYGNPTHLFLDPRRHADLVRSFFPKARYDLLGRTKDGVVGLDIGGYVSPAGNISFEPNTFITDGGAPPTAARGSNPPAAPTSVTLAAGAVGAGETSVFESADAGDYRYSVVAVSRGGKSVGTAAAAAVTVAAGQKVTVTINEGAGSPQARYFEVYRTEKDGLAGTEKLVGKVKRTAGTVAFSDLNAKRPGTTIAILFQMNLEAVAFKQLAPMVKIPLATIDPSIRWMQLIYGVPALYTPGKILMFKNIGRAAGGL